MVSAAPSIPAERPVQSSATTLPPLWVLPSVRAGEHDDQVASSETEKITP
jgi:hypothetical protein